MKKRIIISIIALVVATCLVIGFYMDGTFLSFGSEEQQITYETENCSMEIKIDGKYISNDELNDWIIKRVRYVEDQLDFEPMSEADAETMLSTLGEEKMELSYNEIIEKIGTNLDLCETATKFFVKLSDGKTKECVTEVKVTGVELETFLKEFDRVQLEASEENLAVNLSVAPDHYYLGPTTDGGLEVIETCGSNFVQSQFFIRYGDIDKLNSIRDEDNYEYQSAGVAMTSDGVIEGGVRHQFKETEDGFIVRLCVEFPAVLPNSILKNHQMHLACEFSHWIAWVGSLD